MYFKGKSKSWILIFFCLFVVIVGCQKEVEAGPTAPDFSLTNLSGKNRDFRAIPRQSGTLRFLGYMVPAMQDDYPSIDKASRKI